MKRLFTRSAVAAGAAALAIALTPVVADAGEMPNVTVSGTATCGTAGPVGRYTLNWTVTNGEQIAAQITSAVESGAFTGNVTFTPNPVPAASSATGSDGPVDNTTGTVTLTVAYSLVGGGSFTATGSIPLTGTCVIPSTTSSSTTSSSTSSPSSTSTTAVVRATVVTPRFTG